MDAYLNRDDAARGYTIAFWRGRHAVELTDLTDDELASFWAELVQVMRALEQRYQPRKVNMLMLGNRVPHLHAHIVPRYDDDPDPGRPPRFLMGDTEWRPIDDETYLPDVAALRELLSG